MTQKKRKKKNRSAGGTHRIPLRASHESISAAARVTTKFNVLEAEAPESAGVQPRIEETKRVPRAGNDEIIIKRDYCRHSLDAGSQLGA